MDSDSHSLTRTLKFNNSVKLKNNASSDSSLATGCMVYQLKTVHKKQKQKQTNKQTNKQTKKNNNLTNKNKNQTKKNVRRADANEI